MPSRALVHFFLTWWGVWLIAALDATVIFTFPLALDAVVIVMASMHRNVFWLTPILATAGSLVGALTSIRVGEIVGEQGLARVVPSRSLDRIKKHMAGNRVTALALAPLMPPPFPFTAVIVAAGALSAGRVRILAALAVGLSIRFWLESVLALVYGRRIIRWIDSDIARDIAIGAIVLAIVATTISILRLTIWRPHKAVAAGRA